MSRPPPLHNPATDLASISASLPALWGYIEPALDHIFRSPSNDMAKAPKIDASYYMWIAAALFNYMKPSKGDARSSADLYARLDAYFAGVAQELLLGVPQDRDPNTLVQYLVPTYTRYAAGAVVANRMLNNLNRHFVKREIDEGRGWLPLTSTHEPGLSELSGSRRTRERHLSELRKWGWEEGEPEEVLMQAQASGEAASEQKRIVWIASLAHRRFRTEFLEPLLAAPRSGTVTISEGANRSPRPKSRMERAAEELTKSTSSIPEVATQLAKDMTHMLKRCGVQPDHPVRKQLDSYIDSVASFEPTET
ncbi:hypothetical protein DENSPDRAFT_838219 [Dentipellis sp. KUC8613]|nr:hypothetical protein DENSPDRAFT_838219 [Dentipellis sp. KUC8613]